MRRKAILFNKPKFRHKHLQLWRCIANFPYKDSCLPLQSRYKKGFVWSSRWWSIFIVQFIWHILFNHLPLFHNSWFIGVFPIFDIPLVLIRKSEKAYTYRATGVTVSENAYTYCAIGVTVKTNLRETKLPRTSLKRVFQFLFFFQNRYHFTV